MNKKNTKCVDKKEQEKTIFHSDKREQSDGKAIKSDGQVTESLGYERYRVLLDNGVMILATLSGRIRQHHIRVMVGDRVKVDLSPYDLTRGRISYRYNSNKK